MRASEVLLRAEACCGERSHGMASRSFSLPAKIDARGAEIQFKDGVLILTLQKRASADTSGNKVVLEFQPLAAHMVRAGAYPAISQP